MRILLATLLAACALSAGAAQTRDWSFRVLLDGREIGRHSFSLRAAGPAQELRSDARFDVRLLAFSAYRYRHVATERWQDGCLVALDSLTETNGEREAVNAVTSRGRLQVGRGERRDELDGCVMSFAYWNPRILSSSRLLNSQTGELLPVKATPQGIEHLEVRGERLAAQRHRITAPGLRVDLWYVDGQWVALEADAKGGRRLRYELL
jgi:hypothetical protein